MIATEEVRTTAPGAAFNKPAYRYIRAADRLPTTDEAWGAADPMVLVKLFDPAGAGTWYIAGYDRETGRAFGAVRIHELEVGDFDIWELVGLRGRPFGLPIERDLHWRPAHLSAVLDGSSR